MRFEQNRRINRRMSIVGTAEIFDLASKEVKVNHFIDFTQLVIFGCKPLQCTDSIPVCLLLCSTNLPIFYNN